MLQSGGNGGAKFKWNSDDTNCFYDSAGDHRPQHPAVQCVVLHARRDQRRWTSANYRLSNWSPASVGESAQLKPPGVGLLRQGSTTGAIGFGTLEFGGKYRDGHK